MASTGAPEGNSIRVSSRAPKPRKGFPHDYWGAGQVEFDNDGNILEVGPNRKRKPGALTPAKPKGRPPKVARENIEYQEGLSVLLKSSSPTTQLWEPNEDAIRDSAKPLAPKLSRFIGYSSASKEHDRADGHKGEETRRNGEGPYYGRGRHDSASRPNNSEDTVEPQHEQQSFERHRPSVNGESPSSTNGNQVQIAASASQQPIQYNSLNGSGDNGVEAEEIVSTVVRQPSVSDYSADQLKAGVSDAEMLRDGVPSNSTRTAEPEQDSIKTLSHNNVISPGEGISGHTISGGIPETPSQEDEDLRLGKLVRKYRETLGLRNDAKVESAKHSKLLEEVARQIEDLDKQITRLKDTAASCKFILDISNQKRDALSARTASIRRELGIDQNE